MLGLTVTSWIVIILYKYVNCIDCLWISIPITPFASASLTVRSGGTPMFGSRVATLTMLESIINRMIPLNEKKAKDRFKIM